ncbi:MAG: AMP-binding protein [Bacilli bacterium]|nr:AMP-binding protein [Bacilli bacterium]
MKNKQQLITQFVLSAADLLKTSRHFVNIYQQMMHQNKKNVYAEFTGLNSRIKKYKYSKMDENVKKYALYLSNKIKKEGTNRVVLKVANCPSWGEIFWALLMSGYVPVLVDAKLPRENVINLANQAKAIAIISDDNHEYTINKVRLDNILQNAKEEMSNPSWADEVIFSSSGTTGDAKLMVFNGENFVNQICCSLKMTEESLDIMYPKKVGQIKILAMIPFHHIFGFVAVFLWYTFYGTTLVFPKSNTPSDLLSICQRTGITHVYSVPLFWDSLALSIKRKFAMQSEDKQKLLEKMMAYNLGEMDAQEAGFASKKIVADKIKSMILGKHVRYCISGGGYLSNETLRAINGLGYPLYNGYGMTEVGVTSVELSPDVKQRLLGYIGKPLNGVEYKVNDADNELLIKSPTIHIREIIAGVEKETVLDNGYFHTGDIVNQGETGYIMKGRMKDVIINANGENIFPDELEIYFKDLPNVTNLSVLGVVNKDKALHEDIVLVLELDDKTSEEALKELEKTIKGIKLPHDTKIDAVYLAKNRLPMANNMKVKRFAIKKEIENGSNKYVLINSKKVSSKTRKLSEEALTKILPPVRELFSKILVLPTFKIDDEDHWINDLGGDSMNYVELVQEVDRYFDIEVPEEQYGKLTCVNDFVEEIARLLKQK